MHYYDIPTVENVSTGNFDKVSKRDVITNNKRTYADVVSDKKRIKDNDLKFVIILLK